MLTLELLHISCAAPEGHTHRDGQQATERERQKDGQRDEVKEKKVLHQESRRQQLRGRGGGRAGRWVSAEEHEQGRNAGGKDGQKRRRQRRDTGGNWRRVG